VHVGSCAIGEDFQPPGVPAFRARMNEGTRGRKMEHLVEGVGDAIAKESWYAAVTLALVLPDACAVIEHPLAHVGARYQAWANTYLVPHVTAGGRSYLTGRELYRLRCVFLHEADLRVSDDVPQHPDNGVAMFEVLNEVGLLVSESDVVPCRGLATLPGPADRHLRRWRERLVRVGLSRC
jgi:hypothetical protein